MLVTEFLFLILVMVLSTKFIIFRRKRQKLYDLAAKLPESKESWLSLQRSLLFLPQKDVLLQLINSIRKDTPITKFWLGSNLVIFTEDLEFIQKVFTECYDKPSRIYKTLKVGNSILTAVGDKQKEARRIIQCAFGLKVLKNYPEVFDMISKRVINKMESDCEIDPCGFFEAFAIDCYFHTNLNINFESYQSEIHKVFKRFAVSSMTLLRNSLFCFNPITLKFTSTYWEYATDLKDLERCCVEILRGNSENGVLPGNKIILLLMDENNQFVWQDIKDHLKMLSIASFDASAKTLSALLVMLAKYKNIQEKLISEIDGIYCAKKNVNFSLDFLKKFDYLDAVLNETLRLFTVNPILLREASEDTEINGFIIPRNATIVASIHGIHRNIKYWGSDAEIFRPERFQEGIKHANAFVPFGVGKRNCIGSVFATLLIKVFIINLLRSFTVKSSSSDDLEVEIDLNLNITKGNKIIIEKRQ